MRRVNAQDGILRRRDDDFDLVTKLCSDKITDGCPVIGAIGNEPGDGSVDLGQKFRKRCGVANAFQRQSGRGFRR